jgi:hypothetical protein
MYKNFDKARVLAQEVGNFKPYFRKEKLINGKSDTFKSFSSKDVISYDGKDVTIRRMFSMMELFLSLVFSSDCMTVLYAHIQT